MTKRLYEHLVKPLSAGSTSRQVTRKQTATFDNGPGGAAQQVWLNGHDHLEGINLNFAWGLYNELGDWHSSRTLHAHPYPECHLFVGLNTANINYLGAEIECRLGEEQETYTLNEPTVVVIPAGLPHGPTVTKRIFSPKGFGYYMMAPSTKPATSWLNQATGPAGSTGKYAHLVKPLKSFILTERGKINPSRFSPEQMKQRQAERTNNRMKLGPGNADHLAWLFGEDLGGLKVNMDWGFFSKPGLWHRGVGAHVHATDEVLVFVGTDPKDIDYLGAEIEIDLGHEHERYLINQPSVVVCRAGLPHAPIVTRWVDKPYAFFSINLSAESVMQFID